MGKSRFVEIILFFSGLGLSFITNLLSSDSEVTGFYLSHKLLVLWVGCGLTFLSVYLAFKSRVRADQSISTNTSQLKFIFSIVISGFLCFLLGGVVGFVVLYISHFFSVSQDLITAIACGYSGLS